MFVGSNVAVFNAVAVGVKVRVTVDVGVGVGGSPNISKYPLFFHVSPTNICTS